VAIALDASFVARAFIGDMEKTKEIFRRAITHKGYALVDVFQPCVTFNKQNTYQWFKENAYYLDDAHDCKNRNLAFQKATEKEKLPLGVFYMSPEKPTFEDNVRTHENAAQPLFRQETDFGKLQSLIDSFVK
jgi:2-oxoglutarate ferredoxin oxidoreductase subunit beta